MSSGSHMLRYGRSRPCKGDGSRTEYQMTLKWQAFPEYDQELLAADHEGLTAKQIAERFTARFGVPVNSDQITGRLTRLHDRGAIAGTPQERFEAAVQTEQRKLADRALAREMASAVKGQARWQDFLDIVQGEMARATRQEIIRPLVIPQGSGTPETMTVLVGDIHIGKLVDPAVVGDGFGYSTPIFEQRFERLKDRVLRLFSLHSQTAPITRIRIYFLGDGVDGVDMRRGHAHRVDIQTATGQTLVLVYAFEGWLRELALALGVEIEVIWDFGNHGRVGEFGVNLPADNWDYIAGVMLGIAIRDLTPQVRLTATSQKYTLTDLGPYRVYSSHGDGVKGGDGFAGLPINGLARALAKDTGLHQQLFGLYLTAHFHTPQDITTQTGRILMNGAWDGGDDYSINQLKAASEPVQIAFGIHPERGITWKSEINLAPSRRKPTPVQS